MNPDPSWSDRDDPPGRSVIRYRILGPLELHGDGGWRSLTAAKPRTLLAVLLCHPNAMVSSDRLLDELWDVDPPATARSLLHGYTATVRRMLGDPDGRLLVTRPGGYQLTVEPGDLDAHRFTALVETGRQRLRDGAAEAASASLTEALALWRGDPLSDVAATESVQAERSRLEAMLLTATETRIEAELACGRHQDVLPELGTLVREHPLREELRRHLMLALYRSGRQADALETYRELRQHLVESLGIEPGPLVQNLHREILTGADSLTAPVTPAIPRQLPPDAVSFSGRVTERDLLERLLTSDRSAAICGPAGIGKSALAVHVAHRLTDRFRDGVLYVDLCGANVGLRPLDSYPVLTRFLRSLGVPATDVPTDPDEATALFRTLVAGRCLLLVLDNAADAGQVQPLLPGSTGSSVLITSREPLTTLDGATTLHLTALPAETAVDLLARLVGPGRVAGEPEAAAELVDRCGRLPLAVRIAGARLAARPGWTVRAMAGRLADERHRLDELQLGDLAVRSSFQVSYSALTGTDGTDRTGETGDRATARLFRLLGLLDVPDVGLGIATVLDGRSQAEVDRSLDRLVSAQLVTEAATDRYGLHDLLRLFARELADRFDPATERSAAVDRAIRSYVTTAVHACRLVAPTDPRIGQPDEEAPGLPLPDRDAAVDWLETERPNLVAIAGQAADDEATAAHAVRLASVLFRFLDMRGHWPEIVELSRTALRAARRIGDRAGEAQAHNDLGAAYVRRQRYADAITELEAGLAIRRELGDPAGIGASLNNLGMVYKHLRRFDEAVACLQASLDVRRKHGDRHSVSRTLDNLGVVLLAAGRPEASVERHEQGLAIARELDDQLLQGLILGNLAEAYRLADNPQAALQHAREAVWICRRLGHQAGEADALRGLGAAYRALGRERRGRAALRAALAIYERFGSFHVAELRAALGSSADVPSAVQPDSSDGT